MTTSRVDAQIVRVSEDNGELVFDALLTGCGTTTHRIVFSHYFPPDDNQVTYRLLCDEVTTRALQDGHAGYGPELVAHFSVDAEEIAVDIAGVDASDFRTAFRYFNAGYNLIIPEAVIEPHRPEPAQHGSFLSYEAEGEEHRLPITEITARGSVMTAATSLTMAVSLGYRNAEAVMACMGETPRVTSLIYEGRVTCTSVTLIEDQRVLQIEATPVDDVTYPVTWSYDEGQHTNIVVQGVYRISAETYSTVISLSQIYGLPFMAVFTPLVLQPETITPSMGAYRAELVHAYFRDLERYIEHPYPEHVQVGMSPENFASAQSVGIVRAPEGNLHGLFRYSVVPDYLREPNALPDEEIVRAVHELEYPRTSLIRQGVDMAYGPDCTVVSEAPASFPQELLSTRDAIGQSLQSMGRALSGLWGNTRQVQDSFIIDSIPASLRNYSTADAHAAQAIARAFGTSQDSASAETPQSTGTPTEQLMSDEELETEARDLLNVSTADRASYLSDMRVTHSDEEITMIRNRAQQLLLASELPEPTTHLRDTVTAYMNVAEEEVPLAAAAMARDTSYSTFAQMRALCTDRHRRAALISAYEQHRAQSTDTDTDTQEETSVMPWGRTPIRNREEDIRALDEVLGINIPTATQTATRAAMMAEQPNEPVRDVRDLRLFGISINEADFDTLVALAYRTDVITDYDEEAGGDHEEQLRERLRANALLRQENIASSFFAQSPIIDTEMRGTVSGRFSSRNGPDPHNTRRPTRNPNLWAREQIVSNVASYLTRHGLEPDTSVAWQGNSGSLVAIAQTQKAYTILQDWLASRIAQGVVEDVGFFSVTLRIRSRDPINRGKRILRIEED